MPAWALAFLGGCAQVAPSRNVGRWAPPSPAVPWTPPPEARRTEGPAPAPAPEIPEAWRTGKTILTLPQVLDMALRNNPSTRAAWFRARAAAAQLGSKRAEYFPEIDLRGNLTRQKVAAIGGQSTFIQTTWGPSAALSWLLLDFGGRAADVDEARDALFAANWRHESAVQNLVLLVEDAYYGYLDAKGQLAAARASLAQARKNLDAAQSRHDAGVATIADVLQARTAFSQAQLALDVIEGRIQTIRGGLATALGLPASYAELPIEVGDLPESIDVEAAGRAVDDLIARAESERPDLAATRADVSRAWAHMRSVRSEGLPTFGAAASAGRTFYWRPAGSPTTTYSGTLQLQVPIFPGGQKSYDTLQAREEAEAAQADFESLRQQVILQVWTSYFDLKTAAQRIGTTRTLLESAGQSEQVALGRYKEGVGSILDLLTAESALASARAQGVQARADWFQALARLAHDTGSLPESEEGKP
jgi:outer membrane protein